jgi:hypothetical protein
MLDGPQGGERQQSMQNAAREAFPQAEELSDEIPF